MTIASANPPTRDLHGEAFRWPGGRRIAAIANISYEAWGEDAAPGMSPMGNPLGAGAFDFNARSWGDYGADHGIHRLLGVLNRAAVHGSVMVSGVLAKRFPDNVRAIVDGGHEVIAHGYAQELVPAALSEAEDRVSIEKTTEALQAVTGERPLGWASPRNTSGPRTHELLASAGYRWHSDSLRADLPYRQTFGDTSIWAIPFGMDLNDLPHAMRFGRTPRQYVEMFADLLAHINDENEQASILDVTAHCHNYGRPGGAWAFATVVTELSRRDDLWLATRAQIIDHIQAAETARDQGRT
jgi:peptidoglycan/xylan/chitin deacetylase (PgdA/CDA1 family)